MSGRFPKNSRGRAAKSGGYHNEWNDRRESDYVEYSRQRLRSNNDRDNRRHDRAPPMDNGTFADFVRMYQEAQRQMAPRYEPGRYSPPPSGSTKKPKTRKSKKKKSTPTSSNAPSTTDEGERRNIMPELQRSSGQLNTLIDNSVINATVPKGKKRVARPESQYLTHVVDVGSEPPEVDESEGVVYTYGKYAYRSTLKVIEGAQVLVISNTGYVLVNQSQNYLSLPGGKREPGETPEETIIRELKEEFGEDAAAKFSLLGSQAFITSSEGTVDREPVKYISVVFPAYLEGPIDHISKKKVTWASTTTSTRDIHAMVYRNLTHFFMRQQRGVVPSSINAHPLFHSDQDFSQSTKWIIEISTPNMTGTGEEHPCIAESRKTKSIEDRVEEREQDSMLNTIMQAQTRKMSTATHETLQSMAALMDSIDDA